MKLNLLLIATLVVCLPALLFSQTYQWQYMGYFPDETTLLNSAHGIAVDKDGKVWVGPYYGFTVEGKGENRVYVFEPDGTPAPFSPITKVIIAPEDTLYFGFITGLAPDHEGNIIVSLHGRREDETRANNTSTAHLVRLSAETGELLNYADVTFMRLENVAHAPNRAGVTVDGFVFISFVFPSTPIIILTPDLSAEIGRVTEDKLGFSRSFEVTWDGRYVFNPSDKMRTDVYFSEDGIAGVYELYDTTLAAGMDPGAIHRDPTNDEIIWMTATGTGNNPLAEQPWDKMKIYAIHHPTGEAVDSLVFQYDETPWFIPRSMGISPDGNIIYAGIFRTGAPAVQKFERVEVVSVRPDERFIAERFTLNQNYPNPFNPSTEISFSITEAGYTTLSVYDLLGRNVATLVEDNLAAGSYSVTFDATHLTSGTYIYILESNGQRAAKRMLLVK